MKKVIEIILIIFIWYGVRVVMVTTGVMFIYIPYLDDSINFLITFFGDNGKFREWWYQQEQYLRYRFYS